jgi:hypothetical protein
MPRADGELGPSGKLTLPFVPPFWYYPIMSKSKKVPPKKRGRPATGRDPVTAIRLSPKIRSTVDRWAARQFDRPGRSEAIRRLVELGLASAQPVRLRGKKSTSKASDMAGKEIDRMGDKSATDEERTSRKRRLLKGPTEFRDFRSDHPKGTG